MTEEQTYQLFCFNKVISDAGKREYPRQTLLFRSDGCDGWIDGCDQR